MRFEEVTKRYPRGWTEGEEPRYASLRHDLASVGKRLTQGLEVDLLVRQGPWR